MPRVILTDNYDREIYPEQFVSGILSDEEAVKLKDELNAKEPVTGEIYYQVVPDNYNLFPGIEN